MRNEFIQVLQREQDEALLLLESNPFLTSLFTKYVTEWKGYTSEDKGLRESYDLLWKNSKEAAEEAERDRAKFSKESAQLKAVVEEERAARAQAEDLLTAALEAKEQAVRESFELRAELENAQSQREKENVCLDSEI